MASQKRIDPQHRAAAKKASRREDRARLEQGQGAEAIQKANSIFPESFFKNGRFSNLAAAVGA